MDEETRVRPTLSVLLPTKNDGWLLGRQLDCIVPQLRECDELIVVPNGCTDRTQWLLDQYDHPNIKRYFHREALGVCGGYNFAASKATGTWVLGASGNDEIQPGAFAEWLKAAIAWPSARVMFGCITTWDRLWWLPETGFVQTGWLPAIWMKDGWKTHGAAAFIRRDTWGDGYNPLYEWMADHIQTMMIAFKHGCVDLHAAISKVNFVAGGFSQAHMIDERFNAVIREVRKEVDFIKDEKLRQAWDIFHKITGFLNERT